MEKNISVTKEKDVDLFRIKLICHTFNYFGMNNALKCLRHISPNATNVIHQGIHKYCQSGALAEATKMLSMSPKYFANASKDFLEASKEVTEDVVMLPR